MKKTIIILFISHIAFSQTATLDTNTILIGQQINFTISNNVKSNKSWPVYKESLVEGIEIIKTSSIDTNDNIITQSFVITAWDSGSYYIPPISFSPTNITEGNILNVKTPKLDESAELKDIKEPIKEPIGWSDIWPWLISIIMLSLIIYILKKYVFNKKEIIKNTQPKSIIPADIIALKELSKLDSAKIWQQGKIKEYHSQLSEIIRRYIENRFNSLALELTTHEILQNLASYIKEVQLNNLKILLERADLAKFAKSKPSDNNNIESMSLAKEFVRNTKEKLKMDNYTFVNNEFFYLLIIPILILIWYALKYKSYSSNILFSETTSISNIVTLKQRLRHLPFLLKSIAAVLLIIALARPQSSSNWEESTTEGIDIVLSMDISGSMLARDLKPDRLEAAKDVAINFISKRKNDRVGLVIFAGESFTQCPLTTDHNVLINLFQDVKSGMIDDGTAIGMGLATAVNRLKDSKAISKVIILLTDGVNNSGMVPPLTAAEIAKKFGIRVYTIGVGTEGFAPYPFQTPFGVQYQDVEVRIDEVTLQDIATLTNGKYFRATNNNSLKEIYKSIDKLEKSKIEVTKFHKRTEEFFPLALSAFILLLLGFILQITYLKQIP